TCRKRRPATIGFSVLGKFRSGSGDLRMVRRGREVVPQMPRVAAVDVFDSTKPVLVSQVIGTWRAMALTAKPETVSGAKFALAASSADVSTPGTPLAPARKLPVSKAAPRSMKNGSSTVAANTETLVLFTFA